MSSLTGAIRDTAVVENNIEQQSIGARGHDRRTEGHLRYGTASPPTVLETIWHGRLTWTLRSHVTVARNSTDPLLSLEKSSELEVSTVAVWVKLPACSSVSQPSSMFGACCAHATCAWVHHSADAGGHHGFDDDGLVLARSERAQLTAVT